MESRHAKGVDTSGEGGGRSQTPQISHRLGLGEEFLT